MFGGTMTLGEFTQFAALRILGAAGLSLAVSATAYAADTDLDPAFSLIQPQPGIHSISMSFGTPLPATTMATLAVELDEVDVTRMLRPSGDGTLEVRPAKPLGVGAHEMRLYRLTSDKRDYELVDIYSFSIEPDAGWSLESASINATHTAAFNTRGDRSWGTGTSAGHLAADARNGKWLAETQIDYLAASERRTRLDDAPVDIGNYTAALTHEGDTSDLGLRAGHQTMDADPLLISNLNRRGVSVSIDTKQKTYGATAFGLRSEDSFTADNFSGLGDADEQLFGGAVYATPIQADWGSIKTSLSAYRGEGSTLGGTATGEADGVAGAIAVDAFKGRANLEVGFAHSRTDLDGAQSILTRQNDNAVSGELNVIIVRPEPGEGGKIVWTSGYQRIGTSFFSFANPFLTSDLEEMSTGLEYSALSFTLQGEVVHQESNVADNAALPTDRAIITRLTGAYFPFATSEAPEWLGQLTVSFGIDTGWTDRIDRPAAYVDVEAQATQAYLGLSAATPKFSWGVTGAVADFEDDANGTADQRTWSSLVFASWTPNDWLSADTSVQWQHGIYTTGQSDDVSLSTSLTAWVIKDTLSTTAGYLGNFSSEAGSYEGWENYVELNWIPREGHSLAIRGGASGGDAILTPGRSRVEYFGGLVYRITTDFSR